MDFLQPSGLWESDSGVLCIQFQFKDSEAFVCIRSQSRNPVDTVRGKMQENLFQLSHPGFVCAEWHNCVSAEKCSFSTSGRLHWRPHPGPGCWAGAGSVPLAQSCGVSLERVASTELLPAPSSLGCEICCLSVCSDNTLVEVCVIKMPAQTAACLVFRERVKIPAPDRCCYSVMLR